MTDAARDVARAAEQSPLMRGLARGGYAANGVMHVLLGAIMITLALGGGGDADQAGAFAAVTEAPLGLAGVWVLAVLLAALGVWHSLRTVRVRGGDLRAWGRRVSPAAQAVVYFVLAGIATNVALGARPDSDERAKEASQGLLATPGGVFVLAAAGIGIAVTGICFASIGVRRSFDKVVRIPDGPAGRTLTVAAVVGYLGKGVAIGIVGVLILVAAFRHDPGAAGGLEAAIHGLLEQAFGPILVVLVGLGLISYAVFSFLRVRYAKL
ncbi:DUF1206 domain-containing protein [Microbacterium sp. 179-B 1A2 NHS]|uniref:DUF1206 domain-containing protein n=1 Tax=Microbacterium sp. 179-B 1A2 NHS TaxID=3142383 RepID=UPI00399F5488